MGADDNMHIESLPGRTRRKGRHAARAAFYRAFLLGQRLHVDILPRHFYSAVPDILELRRDQRWREPSSMVGVAGAETGPQLAELTSWFSPDVTDGLKRRDMHREACLANGEAGFGPVESDILYAFIAAKRPARVIQVGAGVSTAVILAAAREHDIDVQITCIDPFPSRFLTDLEATGQIELIALPAQEVQLERLTKLDDRDLYFVDSTHTVKPGSEVNRIVLEVLPRLPPGVFIHFHDIYFPYDYSRDILDEKLYFWTESTLLHAYLINNASTSLLVSTSMLHYEQKPALQELLPRYLPERDSDGLRVCDASPGHFPASTYLFVGGQRP